MNVKAAIIMENVLNVGILNYNPLNALRERADFSLLNKTGNNTPKNVHQNVKNVNSQSIIVLNVKKGSKEILLLPVLVKRDIMIIMD